MSDSKRKPLTVNTAFLAMEKAVNGADTLAFIPLIMHYIGIRRSQRKN